MTTSGEGRESVIAAPLSAPGSSRRIEPRALLMVGVGAAGVAAAGLTAWATAASDTIVDPAGSSAWRCLVVGSYVGVGLYTWWRGPQSRLGPIVAGAGFVYAATSLAVLSPPVAHSLGLTALAVAIVYTAWMYLSYPGGRLETRLERDFMLALAVTSAVLWGLILLLAPRFSLWDSLVDCGSHCPGNGLQVLSGANGVADALNIALNVVFTISLICISAMIFRKARSPVYMRRRAMLPLALVFGASLIEWVVALLVNAEDPGTKDALRIADGVLLLAVPIAIVVGQVRGDIFAGKSLGRIAARASAAPLPAPAVQRVIAEALGDSTVTLALWDSSRGGFSDVHGEPLELPEESPTRAVTYVTQGDHPPAALIHDPTLETDSDIVRGLAATALLLVEKRRLVDDLQASRSRIVAAGERERRRLERDLHDGAQTRLMAIQVNLRLAQRAQGKELDDLLETIGGHAQEAVEELRSLAHGIYPGVLRDCGLGDALRSFAVTAPVRISVDDDGLGRFSPAVEAAIYFCSLEAIQNTIKHAGSGASVVVTLRRHGDEVEFAIADDGTGIDQSAHQEGTGLIGMRDRIGAVNGELAIASSRRGTRVSGTVTGAGFAPALRHSDDGS